MTPSLNIRRRAAARLCAVGLLVGAVIPAQAMPTFNYDADLEVTWTLTSVTDAGGNAVAQNWSATASGGVFDDSLTASGMATANNGFEIAPPVDLAVGGSLTQSSMVSGSATMGSSQAFGWTEIFLTVANETATELTFLFDGSYLADVNVSGPATGSDDDKAAAYAQLAWLDPDTFALNEVFETIDETTLNPPTQTARLALVVDGNSTGGALLTVDTYGEADASGTIPVPAPLALLAVGLVGLVGLRRSGSAERSHG